MKVKPTAGIILAAGASTRFGEPKQLLRLKDKCLLEWVLDAALHSKLNRVVLVLGHSHQKILQALGERKRHEKLLLVINPQYKKGQSLSLNLGLSKVKDDYLAAMFLLGDQPMISERIIDILIDAYRHSDHKIAVAVHKEKWGHPVIMDMQYRTEILALTKDQTLRDFLNHHRAEILEVEMDHPEILRDIDTMEDYKKELKYRRSL